MTAFDFASTADNLRCVLVRQKTREYRDFAAGKWIPIPADGTIPAACAQPPARLIDKGPARVNWSWTTDLDPAELAGSSLLIFESDGIGTLGRQLDHVPAPYWVTPSTVIAGGWSRR